MADPVTPNYGFTLPTVGLDRDTWGALLNGNWNSVDTLLHSIGVAGNTNASSIATLFSIVRTLLEPIGSLKFWPTGYPPTGWWPCDGTAISRTGFPELFALLGTGWGPGDGSTTFNLPNFQGRVVAHRGDWINFGVSYGEVTHTLSAPEMPAHQHFAQTAPGEGVHQHGYAAQSTGVAGVAPGGVPVTLLTGTTGQLTDAAGAHQHTFVTAMQGGNGPHNNVQPTVALILVIKAYNTY